MIEVILSQYCPPLYYINYRPVSGLISRKTICIQIAFPREFVVAVWSVFTYLPLRGQYRDCM